MDPVDKLQQAADTLYYLGQEFSPGAEKNDYSALFLRTVDKGPLSWIKNQFRDSSKSLTLKIEKKDIFHRIKAYFFKKPYTIKNDSKATKAIMQLSNTLSNTTKAELASRVGAEKLEQIERGREALKSILATVEKAQMKHAPGHEAEIHNLFNTFNLEWKIAPQPADSSLPKEHVQEENIKEEHIKEEHVKEALEASGITTPTENRRPSHRFELGTESTAPNVVASVVQTDAIKEHSKSILKALETIRAKSVNAQDCEEIIQSAGQHFEKLKTAVLNELRKKDSSPEVKEMCDLIQDLYTEAVKVEEMVFEEGYQLKTALLLEELDWGFDTFEELFTWIQSLSTSHALYDSVLYDYFRESEIDTFPSDLNDQDKADYVEEVIKACVEDGDIENPRTIHALMLGKFVERCEESLHRRGQLEDNKALINEQYERIKGLDDTSKVATFKACTNQIIKAFGDIKWPEKDGYVKELQDSLAQISS